MLVTKLSNLIHRLFGSTCTPPDVSELVDTGQDLSVHGNKIRVNVMGPTARATSVVLRSTDTINELVKRSVHAGLRHIEPIVYFPPHCSGPLNYCDALSSLGISEGSTVYLHWCLCGGGRGQDSSHAPEAQDEDTQASPHIRFTRQTGHFNAINPDYFQQTETGLYQCLVCPLSAPMEKKRIRTHETSNAHKQGIRRTSRSQHQPGTAAGPSSSFFPAGPSTSQRLPPDSVRGPLSQMLDNIRTSPYNRHDDSWVDEETGTASIVDWEATGMDMDLQPSLDAQVLMEMAEKTRQYILNPEGIGDDSDSNVDERSNAESSSDSYDAGLSSHLASRSKRKVSDNPDTPFFPWPDRETCVLDILRHIPRCAFSRKQNETIHWAMLALGVTNLPSDRIMDDIDRALQEVCGIESLRYKGALGHIYYTNDMAGIIAQEMANPNVCKHLHFYPEDARDHLSEAWQAARWRDELHSGLTTPMARVNGQDFYIDEISLMRGGACMPRRWFMRGPDIFARVWSATPSPSNSGWVVDTSREYEVAAADLLLCCPRLMEMHHHRNLPDPRQIIGARSSTGAISQWTHPVENPWRLRSNGHRVLAFPMWLYCDDTSGNQSKKWNKHNSFLFTAAGLPRRLVHQESNVHFLSTSNIAPPLEMLDAIVDQLEHSQQHGIWAWDCEFKKKVLLIPSVLAMLGDNPMQSEFACHIGLRGRKFCRMCHVEGDVEGADEDDGGSRGQADSGPAPYDSDASSVGSDASVTSNTPSTNKTKRSNKKSETMAQMVQRVKIFMTIGSLRRREETEAVLRSQLIEACRVGGNAEFKRIKTRTGIKDTFQDFFLTRLFDISTKRGQSKEDKEKAMREVCRTFPSSITSPVWRIKDFDPHSDTPVEILHVILLGFVKYFWRDAIHRLKPDEKATLISRLSSLDTSGLGISRLSGTTLVTYAGSLTGRDFRVIAQVAPFVLYDLLEKDLLECWNALGILVPLVWQPKIENIDQHIQQITSAIVLFLDCTCRVTPCWFNKPKFHIILHLPEHIRRFGPAMLFATEGFESFNAIIRSASIHSNRHAPSRDIAQRMAKGNRVRHLLSGGQFLRNRLTERHGETNKSTNSSRSMWTQQIESTDAHVWSTVGPAALDLLNIHSFGERIFGFGRNDSSEPSIGSCSRRGPEMEWSRTKAARAGFASGLDAHCLVYAPTDTIASNGDACHSGSWIIWASHPHTLRVGRVVESIQISGSLEERRGESSFVIVAPAISSEKDDHYWMPRLQLYHAADWVKINPRDIKCAVNVQHNCVKHKCRLTSSRVVYQEHEVMDRLDKGVSHTVPDDVVLNTAQMRDAIYLSPFRPQMPSYDRDTIITSAAMLEIDERKRKKAKKDQLDAAKIAGAPPSKKTKPASQLQRVLTRPGTQAQQVAGASLPPSGPLSSLSSFQSSFQISGYHPQPPP